MRPTFTIEITREDIIQGWKNRKKLLSITFNCPASLAAQRELGTTKVSSAGGYVYVKRNIEYLYYNSDLQQWQNSWDNRFYSKAKQSKFELKLIQPKAFQA